MAHFECVAQGAGVQPAEYTCDERANVTERILVQVTLTYKAEFPYIRTLLLFSAGISDYGGKLLEYGALWSK